MPRQNSIRALQKLDFAGQSGSRRDLRCERSIPWSDMTPQFNLESSLLFVLAVVIAATAMAALVHGVHSETSCAGILITAAALIVMPALAWLKRRVARATNSPALAADAVQYATCAYLAIITLAGLGINAGFHIRWVDSAAALAALPILLIEGRRAMRGEPCGCH